MAALDQAALNLANSLAVNDIPIKLRCTTCNKLAINAFKLPCCDQSICDTCQASLPETCPVCAHSPLDGTSCKQNKSLRLTIKAFLKSEEKKRSKEVVDSQPPPSAEPAQVDATAIETAAPAETPVAEAGNGAEQFVLDNATIDPPAVDEIVDSVEQVSADQALDTNDEAEGSTAPVAVSPEEALVPQEDVTADIEIDAEQGAEDVNEEDAIKADNGEQDMDTSAQPEAGQDGQQQHGMQNMMAFNPMMQMPGFGGFNPMMGMPGMGMNPMNMPFNGFGGMGMNNMSGMNMGMNFGGGFNGWNGQGMGGGNFGGPGAGYYPQGGYNQHQMHQMHNQQFPNRNSFQNRFRGRGGYGRGRGGFAGGRGGHFNQFQNQNYQNGYNQMGNGMSGGSQADDGSYQGHGNAQNGYESQAQAADGQTGSQADLSADFQPGDAADHDDANDTATNGDMTQGESTNDLEQSNAGENDWEHTVSDLPNTVASGDVQMTVENDQTSDQNGTAMDDGQNGYVQDQSTFDGQWTNGQDMSQDGWSANNDFNGPNSGFQDYNQYTYGFGGRGRGRGGFRGGFRGRGGYQNFRNDMQMPAGPPIEPPINAPTGPKAMREGLPNSGKYSRPQINQPSETPAPHSVHQDEQPQSFAAAPSDRGRSPSRAASEHDRKRKNRDRSHSTSTADVDKDRRRSHRRRHEEKYSDSHDADDRSSRRNRSRSAESSDRRARRRDKEKDKYKSSRSHRDSSRDSRHRRHRSRSPRDNDDEDRKRSRRDRDRDRDYDKDKSRRRHRSRSRGGDDLAKRIEVSRRSRHSRDDGNGAKDDDDEIGFKIKGSRSAMRATPAMGRRESVASKAEVPTTTTADGGAVDIYALEREARHKERVLKEQQRRESATSKGKREFDPPAGPRGKREGKRRGGVFYEDELEDGRGERERESARW